MKIKNTTNAPATLTASSSCTAVVFEVIDASKQRQWGSADGIACIQALQPRTYAPLESVTYASTWKQKNTGNTQVPAGTYHVNADVGQSMTNIKGNEFLCRAELSKNKNFVIQ
ncbi:MAG TPA: BsuPI-related putative proteinase inhibitor [Steroidobacteraceae bacterium]|nr:BsuPI-related putative proteinase inhibitor [Steroidobacteraceae bacterium]